MNSNQLVDFDFSASHFNYIKFCLLENQEEVFKFIKGCMMTTVGAN